MSMAISEIKYLQEREVYKKGDTNINQGLDVIFDCYVSKDINKCSKILELLILPILIFQYSTAYPYGIAKAVVSAIFYLMYICLYINMYIKSKIETREKILQRRILLLNIIFQFVMMTININYCLLGGLNLMSLKGVRTLTVIWVIQLFCAQVI
jgi:hypothetical protein